VPEVVGSHQLYDSTVPATNRYQSSASKIGKSTIRVVIDECIFYTRETGQRKYTLLHKHMYL